MIVNELILIVGPSGSGKTSLIEKIKEDGYPQLLKQFNITIDSSCQYIAAPEFKNLTKSCINQLIIHYDFYTQASINKFKFPDRLLNKYNKITILTLCTSPKILINRNALRLKNLSKYKISKEHKHYKFFKKQREVYRDSYSIKKLYQNWFDYVEKLETKNHYILNTNSTSIIIMNLLDRSINTCVCANSQTSKKPSQLKNIWSKITFFFKIY